MITFENGFPRIPAMTIEEAGSVGDVRKQIVKKYPKLDRQELRLNIWDKREGVMGRRLLKDDEILAGDDYEMFVSIHFN